MTSILRCFTRTVCSNRRQPLWSYRSYTFCAGDRALVQRVKSNDDGRLSRTLRPGRTTAVHNGSIPHADIIGKRPRDTITIKKIDYRLLKPTLEDYIVGTGRIVTPIYPQDANVIVSHLDIHASPPGSAHELGQPLEIFEAGTGHGGLTLHLARAIHAANPPAPAPQTEQDDTVNTISNDQKEPSVQDALETGPAPFPESYRVQRKAVVHTLDINIHNSLLARNIVRQFNRGIYAGNVDFYVDDIPGWIRQQRIARFNSESADTQFLSHAILDLPDCDDYLGDLSSALQTDGKLLVFSPSITQIAACVDTIRKSYLPLIMDTVLELGTGVSGGREWDVRAFKPRSTIKADQGSPVDTENVPENSETAPQTGLVSDAGFEMVCRPTTGKRIAGGGFLGIWQKMSRR